MSAEGSAAIVAVSLGQDDYDILVAERDRYREALERIVRVKVENQPSRFTLSTRRMAAFDVVQEIGRAALVDGADWWLSGLEDSLSSPTRECEDEDINADGVREGNTCIDSEPGDLEFPDDWCMRCYSLLVVRKARAALRGEADAHA